MMRIMHVHAHSKEDIKEVLKKVNLPGIKLGIVTSIQNLDKINIIKELMPDSLIAGQVLGCNAGKAKLIADKVDAFLFIGSGDFHPSRIAYETGKPVYMANPNTNEVALFSNELVEKYKNQVKAKKSKFLIADKLGVIVSTKPGQYQYLKAMKLKDKYPEKKFYYFICNNIEQVEFENFPDIEFWINTACNRIEGKNIINLEDIP